MGWLDGKRALVAGAGSGHAAALIENPPRQRTCVDAQRPSLAAGEVHEREFGRRRTGKPPFGADGREIGERGVIGREQEVIAVIDHHVEGGIVVGAATPSGLAGSLVHGDVRPARRKPHRGGKPGQPGSDDVNGSLHRVWHQMKACRMMIHRSRTRDRWIERRGGDQPRSTRLSRINR